MSLGTRLAAATSLRLAAPGSGTCLRCHTPWRFAPHHTTTYEWHAAPREGRKPIRLSGNSGMFPLCEECWQELGSPEARLPFYVALVEMWTAEGVSREHLTEAHLLRSLRDEVGRRVLDALADLPDLPPLERCAPASPLPPRRSRT